MIVTSFIHFQELSLHFMDKDLIQAIYPKGLDSINPFNL
jgi:hypothetical protein